MPKLYSIIFGESESRIFEDIVIREVRCSLTHKELPFGMSIPEKPSKRTRECLIEIESDMCMCSPVQIMYMHAPSIEKKEKLRNKK